MRGLNVLALGAVLSLLATVPLAAGSAIAMPRSNLVAREVGLGHDRRLAKRRPEFQSIAPVANETHRTSPGHCRVPDNDVTGEVKGCQKLRWDGTADPPPKWFADKLKNQACSQMSGYTFGDNGAATSLTYALRTRAHGDKGNEPDKGGKVPVMLRGMFCADFNGDAPECSGYKHRTKISEEQWKRAFDAVAYEHGGHGFGYCMRFSVNLHPIETAKNDWNAANWKIDETNSGQDRNFGFQAQYAAAQSIEVVRASDTDWHTEDHKLARRTPADSATNADHFFSDLGAGHCTKEGRNNDVTQDVKMCECLEATKFPEPPPQFVAEFEEAAAKRLAIYTWGDHGDSTNVTVGYMRRDEHRRLNDTGDGWLRALAQFQYNSVAPECNRTAEDTFKLNKDEAKAVIVAAQGTGVGEGKCVHGSEAWGMCLMITVSLHPELHNNELFRKAEQLPLESAASLSTRNNVAVNTRSTDAPTYADTKPGYCPNQNMNDKDPSKEYFCCQADLDPAGHNPPHEDDVFAAIQDLCKGIKPLAYGRKQYMTKKAEKATRQFSGFQARMAIEYNSDMPEKTCPGTAGEVFSYSQCETEFTKAYRDGVCGLSGGVAYGYCKKLTLDLHPEVD